MAMLSLEIRTTISSACWITVQTISGRTSAGGFYTYYGHPHPELAERKAEINDAYWPVQQILLGHSRKEAQLFEEGIRDLEMVRF